jgi:hypothetical protein
VQRPIVLFAWLDVPQAPRRLAWLGLP